MTEPTTNTDSPVGEWLPVQALVAVLWLGRPLLWVVGVSSPLTLLLFDALLLSGQILADRPLRKAYGAEFGMRVGPRAWTAALMVLEAFAGILLVRDGWNWLNS